MSEVIKMAEGIVEGEENSLSIFYYIVLIVEKCKYFTYSKNKIIYKVKKKTPKIENKLKQTKLYIKLVKMTTQRTISSDFRKQYFDGIP